MKQLISSLLFFLKKTPKGHKLFRGYYHDGEAVYTYIPHPDNDKHIFDGDFKVIYDFGEGKYGKAKGTYVNNVKQGHWEFVRKGFTTRRSLSVNFAHGQLTGQLECMFSEIGISSIKVSKLSLTVKDGKIVGPVTGSVRNVDISDKYEEDSQMVTQLNFILDECISVLLSLAPRGHFYQKIGL